MLKKILHFIAKYSLMLLVYSIFLAIVGTVFNYSYFIVALTTVIYGYLIYKKILTFSSTWLDE